MHLIAFGTNPNTRPARCVVDPPLRLRVRGEPQILGQMKAAFTLAHKTGATGKILNRLFQQTFSVAKQVRTDTAIGASAVSVADAAVRLSRKIFQNLAEKQVL